MLYSIRNMLKMFPLHGTNLRWLLPLAAVVILPSCGNNPLGVCQRQFWCSTKKAAVLHICHLCCQFVSMTLAMAASSVHPPLRSSTDGTVCTCSPNPDDRDPVPGDLPFLQEIQLALETGLLGLEPKAARSACWAGIRALICKVKSSNYSMTEY